MRTSHRVILALIRREIAGYFSTPTGYVFISLFVFLSAIAAFWQQRFFTTNLANLDQLNLYFPYLLVFFIPAIAMSLWAEEKKQGTEDLLMTLPASDLEIVIGKYVAAVGIYTVALVFSLSHVIVLRWLGRPDPGLMMTTYFGYWLMGSALLAVAMVASLLTENLTVAFILGGLFCGFFVFLDQAGAILAGGWQRIAERLSVVDQFRDLGAGVVTLHSLVYFAALAAIALYLNVVILGRRRWATGEGAPPYAVHYTLRVIALFVALMAVTSLAAQSQARWDATSEKIHSLSDETITLLKGLDPKNPVFIHAYLSPEVPKSYVEARNNLAGTLREIAAYGGQAVNLKITETSKYTPQAREALDRYAIRPFKIPVTEEEAQSSNEIFMGVAFTSGSQEFVIPAFDRGLPPEYEVMRSIRVVSRAKRRKVGVLTTPARLFGGFDFRAKSQGQEWSIVGELKKQYEVQEVSPDGDYPADLDTLIAALPASLEQPQVDRLTAYVKSGKPVLLLVDPMPAFNIELTPTANVQPLMQALGVNWVPDRVAWDAYNPHPQLKTLPKEFVFAGPKSFNEKEPVSSGLQEVVFLYPGVLSVRSDTANKVTPLVETSFESGVEKYDDLVERSPFGGLGINQDLPHKPDGAKRTIALRVSGSQSNAIVVADADLMSEQFFDLRRRGIANLNFDNVTFVLNAVDSLSGDNAFIALRKRRPRYRTLEAVEARTRDFEAQRLKETQQAEGVAEQRLQEAQSRLDRSVREVEARQDLDEQAKRVMIANLQAVENRRLAVSRTTIEDEKQRQIEVARADMESAIRGIENTIKLLAVALPPIPAVVLFILMSIRRLRRERIGVPDDRLLETAASPKEAA